MLPRKSFQQISSPFVPRIRFLTWAWTMHLLQSIGPSQGPLCIAPLCCSPSSCNQTARCLSYSLMKLRMHQYPLHEICRSSSWMSPTPTLSCVVTYWLPYVLRSPSISDASYARLLFPPTTRSLCDPCHVFLWKSVCCSLMYLLRGNCLVSITKPKDLCLDPYGPCIDKFDFLSTLATPAESSLWSYG